MISDLN